MQAALWAFFRFWGYQAVSVQDSADGGSGRHMQVLSAQVVLDGHGACVEAVGGERAA